MRALALLGLLAMVGCGLAAAGLGADSSDAATTPDTTSMVEAASPSPDGGSGHDGSPTPLGDSGVDADVLARGDGSSADTGATDSGDGGSGADTGLPPDAGGVDAIPTPDGASDGTSDGASDDASDGSSAGDGGPPCASAIPSGWNLAVYDLGATACPATFTAHDVAGPPAVGVAACSCTCAVTQDGTCTVGTLTVSSSSGIGTSCNTSTFSGAVNGPGCTPLAVTLTLLGQVQDQASLLPPQGGACADTSHADPTQLTAPTARYCDVPVASADSVCNGTAPSGFAACIATSGATTCPPGTPFVQRYVVEDSVMLQCSACSACALTTTCSNATLTGFRDATCTTSVGSVPINGACNNVTLTGLPPRSVAAIEYTATASSTCTAGASTPAAQLTNPRTICCR